MGKYLRRLHSRLSSGPSAALYALLTPPGQILRKYAITELNLSLNTGKWKYDSWGHFEHPAVQTGAELWPWMPDGAASTIDDCWAGLRNALAGLFCASLHRRTSSPVQAYPLQYSHPPHHLRHATLPSEHICTENVIPFF
ncbi:hypothetical protein BV22DRAFT_1134179 [Leucogyrophana mollusca]|uniref:Uncharacterized protein n=1 Tax=Leucogyrophana mollusca TaxID=85980 RepID=A0ACB8B0B4_9AGAM|nr:hypothetical protein BV22DRAFT_1134179 [Leucogyrophana mollusca]